MITVRVTAAPFDVNAALAALSHPGVGAVASFVGLVRGDNGLIALTLDHYPAMTQSALHILAADAAARWSLHAIAIHHRVGRLQAADPIVFVGCAAAHRAAALDACAFTIDRLKTSAPFWKHESFADGRAHWVDARIDDAAAAARWIKSAPAIS